MNILKYAFGAGVLLTLFIAPTQLSLEPRKGFHLSPADLTLAFTAAVWLLDVVLRREWQRLRPPPCVQVLFVAVAGLSFFVAQDKAFAIKDIVQLVEFFIVGHMLFAAYLREHEGAMRKALTVLFVATAINIGIAVAQYFNADVKVMDVCGTFGNRNVLGGYLALALPMLFAAMLGVWQGVFVQTSRRMIDLSGVLCFAVAVVLVAGLMVNLSGASYFAVAMVLVCMAARYRRKDECFFLNDPQCVGIIGSSDGPTAIFTVVSSPEWLRRLLVRCGLLEFLKRLALQPLLAGCGHHRVFIPLVACLLVAQVYVLPNLPRENDVVHFRSVALYDEDGVVVKRYPDWQAAYNAVLTHPWLGVGMGNYQKRVGEFYDNVPQRTGANEPDTQNLYLVLAASAGFPALLLFIVMLCGAVRRARRAAAHGPGQWLGLGVGGALIAFAFTAVWHPLLVRGIGLPLAFVLALAQVLATGGKSRK